MKYPRRTQEILIVLYALDDLGGIRTRREVIDHISLNRWYEIAGDDLVPTRTSNEPRYRIDLAWARKDAVLGECVNNSERNSWELSRDGKKVLENVCYLFRSGELDIGCLEFLSIFIKRMIVPGFQPKATDRKRNTTHASILDMIKRAQRNSSISSEIASGDMVTEFPG